MKNTDKVTLTVGQLKKLIKESKNTLNRFYIDGGELVDSLNDDSTVGEVWDDGTIQLYNPEAYSNREFMQIANDLANELGVESGDEVWFVDRHENHLKTITL